MVAIGCNCSGYKLKEEAKRYFEENQIEYKDFGTFTEEVLDDSEVIKDVCKSIQKKQCDLGILISGSGFGMSMMSNKFKGIRSVTCFSEESAKQAKAHYNANILAVPANFVNISEAISIIRACIATEVLGGRYQDRLEALEEIETENMK